MVGKMRPATTEADKTRVGYIEELNAVYEPGPDDQRALVVANNQLQMRPGSQLFTRRGLEGRRNVEVKIGTKGAEREVMVDRFGKEVTPDQVRAKNKFVGETTIDNVKVYVREDGSGFDGKKEYDASELAGRGAIDLPEATAKQVSDKVTEAMLKSLTTKKVAGEPADVQTLRGRETAMLPSDPADTLYVIETTDGRRVPIRESQMLGETDIGKGGVAPAGGPMKVVEEPRMALRKPLAMLRARGARFKEAAASQEAGDQVLSEVPTKVVELPARAGTQPGSGAPVPFTRETRPQPLASSTRQMSIKGNVENFPTEGRKDEFARTQPESMSEMVRKSTMDVGRDVRKAAGAEQTGKAAGTVAASIPPIAPGTLKNAPAMPTVQGVERGDTQKVENVSSDFGRMQFTPAELAEMNAPETPAQRKARVMREKRSKLGETPATATIP
jgi:hypothetical protein